MERINVSIVLEEEELEILEKDLVEKRQKFPELDITLDNIIGSYVIAQIMLMKHLKK